MGKFMYTAELATQWHYSFTSYLRGGLLLVLALILSQPGAGWAKGMGDEEVLLAKLNTAAQVQHAEAVDKSRRPAARLVFGGTDQVSAIEKLRAIANAKIASMSPKLKGNDHDAVALWFEKLVDQAQILRANSLRKPAIAMTHAAGKVVAVQQADEDSISAFGIAVGDSLSASLGVAGDTDAFIFSGTAGQAVLIGLTSADFDTYVELEYNDSVIFSDDDGGPGQTSLIEDFILPESGEYTIRVRAYGDNSTGTYQLSLDANQRSVLLGAIPTDGRVVTLPVGVRHYYSLQLSDEAQIELNLASQNFDTFMNIYAGTDLGDVVSGNQVAVNDDGGEGTNSRIIEVLPSGSYLIEARAFSSSGTGEYTLNLFETLLDEDEDSNGEAVIAFGDTVQGGIFPEGDIDGWIFSGSAGEVIEVSMESTDFDTFLSLELAGDVIAIDDDGGAGFNSLLVDFVLPVDGEYVIRAKEFGDNASGTYSLSIVTSSSNFVFNGRITPGVQSGVLSRAVLQFYSFVVTGQAQVQIDLGSEEFDPFLVLYAGEDLKDRVDGNLLLSDDDGGADQNARISGVLSAGVYLVEVRSFGEAATGIYSLNLDVLEIDADEDADGAVVIEFGDTNAGAILPAGDVDRYLFYGVAGDVVDIALTSDAFDAFIELGFDGEVVAVNDDGGAGYNSLLSDFVLPISGEYTIKARDLGNNGIGDYSLAIRKADVPIVLQAAIEPGAYTGAADEASTINLYTFTTTAFSSVQIDLISQDFDAYLVLYAGDRLEDRNDSNVVGFDDDGGVGINARFSGLVSPGTYLIEARPLMIGQLGNYSLNLSLAAIEGDEDDPMAPAITTGDSLAGQIFPVGDVDEYAFSGAAGDQVTIDLQSIDFDTFVELLWDDEVVASNDDGGVDLNSRIESFVLPGTGDYLVRVHELGDDDEGSYGLSLVNVLSQISLMDTLEEGSRAGAIATIGEVQRYPLLIAERANLEIDVASEGFLPALALYGVQQRGENLLAAVDTGLVHIAQEVVPGSYLVEVRSSNGTSTGAYALDLKLATVQESRDGITLNDGELNGIKISAFDPVLTVEPGQKINGSLAITVTNNHPSGEVFPVGATSTWGDHQSSYWEIDNWAGTGNSSLIVDVDLTAPGEVGTYYLLIAAAAQLSVADIMSGTNWVFGSAAVWNDADDIASWDDIQVDQAISRGWVNVEWLGGYTADIGASAVRIEVTEGAGLLNGPVSIDFDIAEGDQVQRSLADVSAGQVVEVELHAAGVEAISGWSARIDFDPEKVLYVSDSFAASDFISGIVALVDEKDGVVEVGGTLLGNGEPGEGNGVLGRLSFVVGEGFSFSADLIVSQVSLRTVDSGRIKQQVRSVATLNAVTSELPSPVSLDLDLAAGDQAERVAFGAAPGVVYQIQLNVNSAPEIRGWSARIEYDPLIFRYVSNSFAASGFIEDLVPLVGEKSGRVDVGGTLLGTDVTGFGNGELGTLSFEILDNYTSGAEVAITQVSFNTVTDGEVIERVRETVSFLASATDGPAGDFSADGVVDFADFFLFADNFGLTLGEPDFDSAFDLNSNGEVDFSDFFIFADSFGEGAQPKLMALAREYIGLPEVAGLEQNYPNPFNSSTIIAYQLSEPGEVRLEIYDIAGQRVRKLLHGYNKTGSYRVVWDGMDQNGRSVSSGVYLYALWAGDERKIKKMLYVK